MKIAISNIAWEPGEELSVRALMKQHGIAGVEIAPTKIWDTPAEIPVDEAEAVRDGWNHDGFSIAALQSLLFGHPELTVFDDAETRAKTDLYLKKIIELSGRLGAGALVFGSPKNRRVGQRSATDVEQIGESFFRSMAESAAGWGTCFCLEPNPPEYGCDYVRTVQEALRVIRSIDHPGLRLNLDTGILTMNQEPIEASIEAAFPWIGHVHLSEPQLGVVGSGSVEHQRVGRILKQLGYAGWVSIEMRSAGNEPNYRAIEAALRSVTSHYGC